MPAYARSQIVVEDKVGVYHCIARCVRQAFLCGADAVTGRDYSHRKVWIVDRLRELAGLFAIEVCNYAVLSTHLHIVLRNRPDLARSWSDDEIALRWCRLFPHGDQATGTPREPDEHDIAMLKASPQRLAELRTRLASLSWFMRCLCEKIARAANREDGASGRFWSGRFKSVALVDEAAALACSVYVDLNPIRAGLAATPEESPHTSGYDRIQSLLEEGRDPSASSEQSGSPETSGRPDAWLCELTLDERAGSHPSNSAEGALGGAPASASNGEPARADVTAAIRACEPAGAAAPNAESAPRGKIARPLPPRASDQGFLPIEVEHYIVLLDWTGRELRADKRGAIPDHLAPILDRLGLNRANWIDTVRGFGRMFRQAAGRASSLADAAARRSRRWFQAARAAFV